MGVMVKTIKTSPEMLTSLFQTADVIWVGFDEPPYVEATIWLYQEKKKKGWIGASLIITNCGIKAATEDEGIFQH